LFGTPLTLGLVKKRLDEFNLTSKVKFHEIKNPATERIPLGRHFEAEFFRVNHSIPDGMGICLKTPVGNIVHTGDFKFDFTPADGLKCDFGKIAEIGRRGVLLTFADSTNAEKPGYTISEKVVNENLAKTIMEAKGRIILATFASLIGRIQNIVNAANRSGRKVFASGRSMITNLEIAEKLGYLKAPQGLIRPLKKGVKLNEIPPNKVLILCTGSQGEELSALTRIALGEHQTIRIREGDTVIFSSTPIIGNERAVVSVTNNLLRLGAKVITNKDLDVHTSGHASQEDLKLMHSLLKPKFLVPVHGELHMRCAHRDLAKTIGMPEGNILLLDNGDILELAPNQTVRKSKSKVRVNNILIDGLGVGDIGTSVLRERETMSENGIVVIVFRAYAKSGKLVGAPDIISRGFVYMKESSAIVEEAKKVATKAYEEVGRKDHKEVRKEVARAVAKFIRQRIDREPLILPYTIEI
ncbi:ribonuclease J, partial [Candidatus Gracilibacteria bacterium]|nr:ribonuclease J [Candidatus Gracilibacteria bacterium]